MKTPRYANVPLRDTSQPGGVVAYQAGSEVRYVTGINLPVAGRVPPGS